MMQENMLGEKLRARMSDILAEYRARKAMNASQAQADYTKADNARNSHHTTSHAAAMDARKRAERDAEKRRTDGIRKIELSHSERVKGLTSRVQAAEDALREEAQKIDGPFASLAETVRVEQNKIPPSHGVIGALARPNSTDDPVPVIVPLLGQKGLLLRGSSLAASEVVDAIFARLIASIPLTSLHVTVFDPEISGLLGTFADLRPAMGERFQPSSFDSDKLRGQLENVLAAVQKNTDRIRSSGERNILSIWESATPKMVFNVLIIDDQPEGMDDNARKLLRRIIESGPTSGAFVILLQTGQRTGRSSDAVRNAFDERTPEQVDDEFNIPDRITLATLDHRNDTAMVRLPQGEVTVRPIGGMNHLAVKELITQVLDVQSQQDGPVIGPERLLPDDGQASAAKGIEIALGEQENGSVLKFKLRSANPPLPNALVGGDVGTGKSNLLHVLINSMAAKYPRAEVEMILLDFKSGTEFQRYAPQNAGPGSNPHWLPNASLIGLESDRSFGLAVLNHLMAELDRRAETFKSAGVSGYDAFRAGGAPMPRLVAIIDEFQTLFDEDDDTAANAVQTLSGIMRKGRAFGVHLVLSTQTLSGIRQLSVQGDAIFAQVPVRVALRLGRSESQVMLAPGNIAASRLQHRGEVIINERSGEDEENNITGVVTHAEPNFTAQLQASLWSKDAAPNPPRLFRGTVYAPRPVAPPRARTIALGETVDVAGTEVIHEFGQDPLRALAIVGSELRASNELVASVLFSGFQGQSYERIIVVGSADTLDYARTLQIETGIPVDLIDHEVAAEWIVAHAEDLRSPKTLVVVSELQRIVSLYDELDSRGTSADSDSAAADLFAPVPEDSDFNDVFDQSQGSSGFNWDTRSAASILANLAKSSSTRSDLVLSSQLFSTVEAVFGYDRQGGNGIAAYALTRVPLDDLRQFLGHGAEQPDASPRFNYTQAGTGAGGVLAIPYGSEQ